MDQLHTYHLAEHAKEVELVTIKSVLSNSQWNLTHIYKNLKKTIMGRISKKAGKSRKTKLSYIHIHRT
jgi:predicted HAD superfamily phosphohydrolase YqeG